MREHQQYFMKLITFLHRQCSIKLIYLYRSWQEEEAEAAPPHPRPPPAEDPVPHPSVPRNHRICCRQGSDAR